MNEALSITAEVRDALANGKPVVALESTLVSHGLPYPENIATARSLERIVREAGAVPATIAVMGGRIRIGLDDTALERLARGEGIRKLSRADLPYAIATGGDGATTVAATMICAALAGIAVFATGGIGGVHRGAETSMDVSADLEELGRTPVAVVCAGAKALLDLPMTLERLETLGVPVVCYRTDWFPAFWSASSGLPAPLRLDDARSIAALIRTKHELALGGGVLIANPIEPHAEIPRDEIAAHVDAALDDARRDGITGKEVTPFLLGRILDRTDGRSLRANVELIEANARLAAQIAIELSKRG